MDYINEFPFADAGEFFESLDARDNADYMLNFTQAQKLFEIVRFAKTIGKGVQNVDCEVKLIPKETCGGINIITDILSFNGEKETQEIARLLSYASAWTVNTMADERVCLSITVPNVYIHK